MALTDSIMSLFGGGNKAASPGVQQQQTQAAENNPSVPSQKTPQSNGTVPAIPPAGQGDKSPLENFADLWKTDPNTKQTNQSLVPNFNMDPAKLLEAAGKVNFTQHIPQELVTKALSGDQTAFLDVINKATQLGFANATAASGELVKNSMGSAQDILKQNVLPTAFREQAITQALNESNPVFADPAVAPMLGMLKDQFQQKYPTASPQEIAKLATDYLGGVSQKISGNGPQPAQQATNPNGFRSAKEEDWEAFFQF